MALASWRRPFAAAVPWTFAALLAAIVVQVGLAGAGLLGGEASWLTVHKEFVHVIEALGLLAIAVAFLGGDRLAGWVAVALYFLVGLQYALIRAPGLLRAAHVLNALLIFGTTLLVVRERLPIRRSAPAAPA